MAPHRLIARRAAVVLGAASLLLAACGDEGEPTTAGAGVDLASTTTEQPDGEEGASEPSPTTAAPTTEDVTPTTGGPANVGAIDPALTSEVCPGLVGFLVRPVGAEPPADDAPLGDALARLAAEAPDPLGAQAAAVLALDELDDGAGSVDDRAEVERIVADGYAGIEGVHGWALNQCPVDGVVWSCLEIDRREVLSTVGEGIGGEESTTTTEPGAATPEAVVSAHEAEGEPVEVRRTEDEVLVAWLDDDGRAVESMTVVEDGGWRDDGGQSCTSSPSGPSEDEGFGMVGEEIPG